MEENKMDKTTEQILRKRMHGLYLSRHCGDITRLSRALMGLHCWFHRNVVFSALIRGADITGWTHALTKTWLYRGTLHGVAFDDLPLLLALHSGETHLSQVLGEENLKKISAEIISLMEDGIYSRAEMRRIFAPVYDAETIEAVLSPWGGIFIYLARQGKVAFRNMTSRDFDLISAEPTQTRDSVLPEILRRYFAAYGPATLADAAWFLGFQKDDKKKLSKLNLEEFSRFEYKNTYYYIEDNADTGDIPKLTLLSGFDPLLVSYAERSAVLPPEYRSSVILKSGICLPTIAVNGQVAGLWNIKKNEPVITFFINQPTRIKNAAAELVDDIHRRTSGVI
jgi:hypothetical protein